MRTSTLVALILSIATSAAADVPDLARPVKAAASTDLVRAAREPAFATVGVEQHLAAKPDAATRLCAYLVTDPNTVGDDNAREVRMTADGCSADRAPVAGQPVETTPPVAPNAGADRY
jgi:hypothetical protein